MVFHAITIIIWLKKFCTFSIIGEGRSKHSFVWAIRATSLITSKLSYYTISETESCQHKWSAYFKTFLRASMWRLLRGYKWASLTLDHSSPLFIFHLWHQPLAASINTLDQNRHTLNNYEYKFTNETILNSVTHQTVWFICITASSFSAATTFCTAMSWV